VPEDYISPQEPLTVVNYPATNHLFYPPELMEKLGKMLDGINQMGESECTTIPQSTGKTLRVDRWANAGINPFPNNDPAPSGQSEALSNSPSAAPQEPYVDDGPMGPDPRQMTLPLEESTSTKLFNGLKKLIPKQEILTQ
jgi:hypothetical protein